MWAYDKTPYSYIVRSYRCNADHVNNVSGYIKLLLP